MALQTNDLQKYGAHVAEINELLKGMDINLQQADTSRLQYNLANLKVRAGTAHAASWALQAVAQLRVLGATPRAGRHCGEGAGLRAECTLQALILDEQNKQNLVAEQMAVGCPALPGLETL